VLPSTSTYIFSNTSRPTHNGLKALWILASYVRQARRNRLDFEFHSVDISQKEQKLPEYLEKQPFGQVPYLVSYLFTLILSILNAS